jgi:hypothetical protein
MVTRAAAGEFRGSVRRSSGIAGQRLRPAGSCVYKAAWGLTASVTGLCGFVLLTRARTRLLCFPADRRTAHQTGGLAIALPL